MASTPRDFMAVATPGAGKTTFALTLASQLVAQRVVERVIVVVPTEHLKIQWAGAAANFGLMLDPKFTNASAVNPAYDGIVVTYAQVGMHPFKHHAVAQARRTLVILDEIHHAGDAKSWGDGVREAYGDVEHRLALTGTPFRSDDSAIPFVRYEEDGEGHLVSRSDYTYGYAEALKDKVVRPVVFLAYSGEAQWRDSAGEEYAARLGEPLNAEQTARAWRTALDPKGDWMKAVLTAAHTRLQKVRAHVPDAGGLVIATDKTTARAYARLLSQISSTPVTTVLSDEVGASKRIDDFSASTDEWMVAVRMVSEGVDVPRLSVGVYATSASTPLFFAQAIGRFVRSRRPGESASIFLPSVPVLLRLAEEMETSRDHVLGKPDRPEGWSDELIEQANREQNEPDAEPNYQAIGASAELDSLIFDGSTYGTATFAGTEEEQDYLGLPGLLDADQVKTLLQKRQSEQLDARAAAAAGAAGAAAAAAHPGTPHTITPGSGTATPGAAAPGTAGSTAFTPGAPSNDPAVDNIPALRSELNARVAIAASSSGRPHGAIHNEVRKACGGPPTALCNAEQLRERIAYLRNW
ncbi:DEAD/DEAH box helicase [Corynebacterium aquatimens]|nr:Type III restriction enzyme, res subunit [Corynebacterium aquatimens]